MNISSFVFYITHYPTIPLALALVIVLFYVIYLHNKIHHFTRGESGASLETLMKKCVDSVAEIEKRNEVISKHALDLNIRLAQCVRNVSTIRFKAFDPNSSNQSFAIALVNEHGDGVILSSLHHRDRVSMFAKPVVKYTSTHDLTEEELSVLEESKKAHKSN